MGLEQFNIQQKILWHTDNLKEWLDGKEVYPITIEIDPTNACNEKCTWCCWKDHRKTKETMSEELLEKIVRNLGKVGVKGIIWTGGGEPLLNKYTVKNMVLSKELGINNGMFTNGILLAPEKIPYIIDSCDWVRISLGAATPKTFKKCHGTEDFYKIKKNIEEFVRVKKERKSDLSVGLSMMVDFGNYHELYLEAVMAKELGVDYFQGKPLNQMGSENAKWWETEVIPLFKKAKDNLEDGSFKILTAQYTQDKYGDQGVKFLSNITPSLKVMDNEAGKCYVHNFVTAITANGDVAFCKNMRDQEKYYLGNLKYNTFEEIWKSDRRKKLIEKINSEGCNTFCQNGRLNEILKFIKSPDPSKHPDFL